jgi:hypothetical protein
MTRTSRALRGYQVYLVLLFHAYFVAEPTSFAFWKLSITAR